jgi:SAM-dependent methyltransferase
MSQLSQVEGRQEVHQGNKAGAISVVVTRERDNCEHPHDVYIARLAKHVRTSSTVDWLDVGCGWHCDWPWAHEREKSLLGAANVYGLDPDWQAVVRHRTIRKRVVGIVEALPYAGDSFDLVSANVVVEHLRYPEIAFAEIFRVLRPGGVFVFRTPSARSYFVRIARRLPQPLKMWLASRVIERRKVEDIYPTYYRANSAEVIEEICRMVGFQRASITITKTRGVLGRFPRLNRVERLLVGKLPGAEGTLLVEAQK